MPKPLEIKRGDIYMIDWGGKAGEHPALIIQNDTGNKHSDSTIVAYITHTAKKYPVVVIFKDHESSLEHGGSVDLGKIMTVPKSILKAKMGHLSTRKIPEVNGAIANSLGLD